MVKILFLILLLLFAAVYTQSSETITAPATLPTSVLSVSGDLPTTCSEMEESIRNCARSGGPYYLNRSTGIRDPYAYTDYLDFTSAKELVYSCELRYISSFNNFYKTAEVTAGDVVPRSIEYSDSAQTDYEYETLWSYIYNPVGSSVKIETDWTYVTDGKGGDITEIHTEVSGGKQVLVTEIKNTQWYTFTLTSYSVTSTPTLTITSPPHSESVVYRAGSTQSN